MSNARRITRNNAKQIFIRVFGVFRRRFFLNPNLSNYLFRSLIITLPIFLATFAFAQQNNNLHIIVSDQNGDSIPNVTARLKREEKIFREIKSSNLQTINFSRIETGRYALEIEAQGFKKHLAEIEVKNGNNTVAVILEITEIVENINVENDKQDKAIDPREGAFTNFLTREQLEALPEDPEELAQALKDQFGQDVIIQVDGLTGGRLPPKSQIASIRVTRSSFDAEYHTLGSTIIDVVSKAGGGRWTGSAAFNFNDESFNARNPFAIRRFPAQMRNFDLMLLGPITKKNTSVIAALYGRSSYRQENVFAATPNGQVSDSIRNQSNSLFSFVKISHNLGKDKSLNISYNSGVSNSSNNGVGGFDLPERAFSSKNFSHQLSVSESGYVGKRFLNEIYSQFTDESLRTTPVSDRPAILVLDAFDAGGAGNLSRSSRQSFLLADNLLFGAGKIHAFKIGGLFEYERRNLESAANQNGTFTFSSLDDFAANAPSTFTQRIGTRTVNFSQFQLGLFVQDDIRLRKSFLLSLGLRYEWQNNLRDKNNFSPRVGFTWSPYKSGKLTFRGGTGVYYNWFETNNLAAILSQSVLQPPETVIINPSFPNPLQSGTSRVLPPSYRQTDGGLKNPYIFLASIGVERQLNKTVSLRVLYKYQKGTHQFRSRDINAPLNFVRPNPDFGRILQVESSAFFAQNSLNIGLNGRLTKSLSYNIDYTLAKNINDTNGIFGLPSDNYNLRLDRSVSNLDRRHRFYGSLYWKIHRSLRFSTIFLAASPLPYTITTGFDNNGDTIFNDRPFGIERNSERGAWQRQVDMNLGWTLGLVKKNAGKSGSPGMIVITSDEASSGDFSVDTKHKYSIKFSVTAKNVFNQPNFTNFVGVQTSPFFRQPVAADDPRRIEFGMRFSF